MFNGVPISLLGERWRLSKVSLSSCMRQVNKFTDNKSEKALEINHEDERVNRIIEFILMHYKEKISLNDIADYLHLNPQYVSRYFSKFNLNEFTAYDGNEHHLMPTIKENYIVDCSSSEGPLNMTWKRIIAFGRAAEGMREELRNQLRMVQKEIIFEYVRFHGILSDEMMVYSEDSSGNPEYNFSYIDQLIDFLLEIKLKPFLELGFMPEQLASEKIYMFNWKANISLPKSMEKWKGFIENFAAHLIERYGIDEVQSWYFQVWNQLALYYTESEKYFVFINDTCQASMHQQRIMARIH